eukprot:7592847-Pyramimonas_sp.AAC.1
MRALPLGQHVGAGTHVSIAAAVLGGAPLVPRSVRKCARLDAGYACEHWRWRLRWSPHYGATK